MYSFKVGVRFFWYNMIMYIAVITIIILIILLVIFWQISTLISIYGGIAYVGSGNKILRSALKLAKLKKGDIFYELGSGMGNGLIIASKEFGASAIGIEISPFHWLISWFRTRSNKNIKMILGNYKKINLADSDVIYCYLSPKLIKELLPKFRKELKKGAFVLSCVFSIPDLRPNIVKEINGKKIYLYRF